MEKEKRIYLVDDYNYEFETSPFNWDDEKFISEAEIQGNVYSLEGFEKAWNDRSLLSNYTIRII